MNLKHEAIIEAAKLHLTGHADDLYDIGIKVKDPEDQLMKMLDYIKRNSGPGHSFPVKVDPDDSEKAKEFYFDGDDSFHMSEVKRIKERKVNADVNTAKKSDLLKAIQEKFPNKEFTHIQCLKLLPDFNHAQKIYVLLRNLLADGKLMETKNGYKLALTEARMRPTSTENFVKDFCAGKTLPITRTRLEIAVSHVVGKTINVKNREQALTTIRTAISDKKKVVASTSPECPRCGTAMTPVTLAETRKAWFCTNDRVSLPR